MLTMEHPGGFTHLDVARGAEGAEHDVQVADCSRKQGRRVQAAGGTSGSLHCSIRCVALHYIFRLVQAMFKAHLYVLLALLGVDHTGTKPGAVQVHSRCALGVSGVSTSIPRPHAATDRTGHLRLAAGSSPSTHYSLCTRCSIHSH